MPVRTTPKRLIATDRLHRPLIASPIRRPHVVLDDSHGKMSRCLDAFGTDDLTIRAGSSTELRQTLAA